MKRARILLSCLVLWAASAARGADLVIIDLQHRPAEEIIPILRPLVSADVGLSGTEYRLIVRAPTTELAKIREVLTVLDRAPRQLLVSVRHRDDLDSRSSVLAAEAEFGNRGANLSTSGGVSTRAATGSGVSSVRILEGASAHIAVGQSVPIVTAIAPVVGARGVGVGFATDYREALSSFTVRPRVNGDRVVLEITTQRHTNVTQSSGDVQRVATTATGKLGEWIDLGGVTDTTVDRRRAVGVGGVERRLGTQTDGRSVAVKVEALLPER